MAAGAFCRDCEIVPYAAAIYGFTFRWIDWVAGVILTVNLALGVVKIAMRIVQWKVRRPVRRFVKQDFADVFVVG